LRRIWTRIQPSINPTIESAETAAMNARWLTAMIERARTFGVGNQEIASALESAIDIRPVTLERDHRNRLVAVVSRSEVTVKDLFGLNDDQ
jgi:hypothetical protein